MNDLSFRSCLCCCCCCVAIASFFSPLFPSPSLFPSLSGRPTPLTYPRNIHSPHPQAVPAPAKNVAAKIAAVAAAVLISAAPVFAGEDPVKNAVCARTPTAKMCLRDSVKR